MDALDEFAGKIQSRIATAEKTPKWTHENIERIMGELAPRREKFDRIAAHLSNDVIRPRVLRLGSFFPNARMDRMQHPDRCILWFGYCERFPANVKLEFAIEPDDRIEQVSVLYEVRIVPTFLKFPAHDKLTLPLEAIDDVRVASWVENQLLGFVDTYLQIDRGPFDQDEEVVTDPVCGMRLSRLSAVVHTDYRGHPYFFCTQECYQQFVADPTHFVLFRPSE